MLPIGGVEPYADTGGTCTMAYIITVAKSLAGTSLSGCALVVTPPSTFCSIMTAEHNSTHYSALIFSQIKADVVPYINMQIQVTYTGMASETYLLGHSNGTVLSYTCEEMPTSSVIFLQASTPKVSISSNKVNNLEFISYLNVNTEVFKRPMTAIQSYSNFVGVELTVLSLSRMMAKFTLLEIAPQAEILLGSPNNNMISIPNPFYSLDYPSVVFQTFIPTQFENRPSFGYFIKLHSTSNNNIIPPLNFPLVPLEGLEFHDMNYYYKNDIDNFQPKMYTNQAFLPFWDVLPPGPRSALTVNPIIEVGLVTVEFSTPTRFSFLQNQEIVPQTIYPSYPFGLVSRGTDTKRNYAVSLATREGQKELLLFVGTPDKNVIQSTLLPTPVDTVAPQIASIDVIVLNQTHSILRVGATDDLSGIDFIIFVTPARQLYINKNNLVSGTLTNGIYEIMVPFKKSFSVTQVLVKDLGGSLNTLNTLNMYFNFGLPYQQLTSKKLLIFTFSKLTVDVSNGPVDVFAYAKLDQTTVERNEQNSIHLKLYFSPMLGNPMVQGIYNESLGQYVFAFRVPAQLMAGALEYSVIVNEEKELTSAILTGLFDTTAQLMVLNTNNTDMMFPLVTSLLTKPISPALLNNSQLLAAIQFVSWTITFSDLSGVKKAIVGISSEFDVQGKNYSFDCAGQTVCQKTVNYFYDLNSCQNMNLFIQYVYTEDMLGNKGESVRYSNTGMHPFYQYDLSTTDFRQITDCTSPPIDTNPPAITQLDIKGTTPTNYQDTVVVTFTVEDDNVGISLDHTPSCYFNAGENEFIQSVANATKLNSDKSVEYTCTFLLSPRFSPVAYLSIYGISDKLFNFIGFSSKGLKDLSLANSYTLQTVPGSFMFIESTSSLENSTDVLYIYGTGFSISSQNAVEIQTDTDKVTINPSTRSGIVLVLNNIPASSQYQITVTNIAQRSNTVTVKGSLPAPSSTPSLTPSLTPSSTPSSNPTPSPTPTPCNSDCGAPLSYGTCLNGACVCNAPHSGLDCKSVITKPIIQPDTDKPSVNLTLPSNTDTGQQSQNSPTFTSFIAVVSIRELDLNGASIAQHEFNNDKWIYIKEGSSKTDQLETIQYKYTIDNTLNTTITSTMQVFSQASNITFGTQQLYMNANTIKFTFNITQYPFTQSTNSLQLVMTAALQSSESVGCSYKEFIDDASNSQYLKLQIQDRTLFGRFIKFGIIDGRERVISNTQLDSSYGGSSLSKSSSDQSFIGLNIPFYIQQAVLDPDFSVLIDSVSASDRENSVCTFESKKKLTTAQIAGIAVGGAVFLFIVTAVSIFFYTKKSTSKLSLKLRRMGSYR
ncbi:hypothetical protein CYY_000382 [Polysphondylium violaceum]|uniref:EGF-like domain-containing protein n=1 Tax=Polysphondylium violaceum TaxID=133409 RepID=A0A8J4Q2W1_9MYCE|nr:hypothetical protein CYY_000382 [Polysphondylium violaceum]